MKARFLGYNYSLDSFYFANESNGKLVSVEASALNIIDRKGNFFGQSINEVEYPELSVQRQKAADCAVHSSVNCILFMKSQKLLPERHPFNQSDRITLYDLFEPVDAGYNQQRAKLAEHSNRVSGRGFWGNLFNGARAETQPQVRQRLLSQEDIPSKIINTYETKDLMRHLGKGYPAILDIPIKTELQVLGEHFSSKAMLPRQPVLVTRPVASSSEQEGAHSVVAIGFTKIGWLSKKIVILDSANGEIYLWDASQLRKIFSGKTTLVFPNQSALDAAYGHN